MPKFYFPDGSLNADVINSEELMINQIFKKEEISMDDFVQITVELLKFPKMFNGVLFNKINKDKKNTISKNDFMK